MSEYGFEDSRPALDAPPRELSPQAAPWNPAQLAQGLRQLTIDTPASEWPTSLDRRDPAHRALIFAAGNPPDVVVPTGGSVTIRAVHWLASCSELIDEESGEARTVYALTLFNVDGKMLRTTSAYALRRLRAALELYTPSEWAEGIDFVIRDRASRMPGRHYHDVRILPRQPRIGG